MEAVNRATIRLGAHPFLRFVGRPRDSEYVPLPSAGKAKTSNDRADGGRSTRDVSTHTQLRYQDVIKTINIKMPPLVSA